MTATRLSLYKLSLVTTNWVELSASEYNEIIIWLDNYVSRTSKPNNINRLFDTFTWFPTWDGSRFWVPLGHLNRLFEQIDARIPAGASVDHHNLSFRERLSGQRSERNGAEVSALRVASLRQRSEM